MFKPFETTFAVHGDVVAGVQQDARADKVFEQVDVLKRTMSDSRWELADLLEEIQSNNYHQAKGFNDFDDYIEHSSFEFGARECRYLLRINKNSRAVGVSRDQLKLVAISKLKEIFSLDPDKQKDHIVRLVEAAKDMTLDTVRDEVRAVKGLDGENELTWRNFQILREAAENVVDPAIERIKREYGDTIDGEGNPKDISDGQALVMMCADKNAEPDYTRQEMEQSLEREGGDGPVEA